MATKGIPSEFYVLFNFCTSAVIWGWRRSFWISVTDIIRRIFFSDILIRKSSVNMERVGRNIFRGGGAEIFKTCVCSGWGEGLCKLMIGSQRGGGAPKMFLDVNSVILTYE